MPPKAKSKATTPWYRCDVCRVILSHKDVALHQEGECPPSADGWAHAFIRKMTLYSWLEEVTSQESLKMFAPEELVDIVWLSTHALQICGFCVGDPVLVTVGTKTAVKSVWTSSEKSITSVIMTKEGMECAFDTTGGPAIISKLPRAFPPAQEICVAPLAPGNNQEYETADILLILRNLYNGKYLSVGNSLLVPYYGKKLRFYVESISPIKQLPLSEQEPKTPDSLDAITENLQNLSFTRTPPVGLCSTPLRPGHDRVTAIQRETVSDLGSFDSKSSDDNYRAEATPRRKSRRKMMEDSYAGSTTEESQLDESQFNETLESPQKRFQPECRFFHMTNSTQWQLSSTADGEEENTSVKTYTTSSIGGLQSVIEELREIMSLALDYSTSQVYGIKVARGVLLFGPPGTGKTILAHALAQESKATVHVLQGSEVFSKLLGETESRLKAFFTKASSSGPAVIILDEVDSLCPKKSNGTELEKRVVSTLSALLDGLNVGTLKVLVLATTSKPDSVDPTLRRPGRLDREVEVPVPTPNERLDILSKLLMGIPHSLTSNQLEAVARSAHGFVGADLASLVSRAGAQAMKESTDGSLPQVLIEHIEWALTKINPSAMREVLVDVPNVYWSDVAGQEDLKLKLRQAVEWPLVHPEAFQRLGIRPPRGILMFGPPGCSKTMIAKALATESKLNFLSIKGPEIFSKWVGESERAVREVFRKARQVAPAVVFFDELDALGGERSSSGSNGGSNVQERVLAQLLTEMDGVTSLGNVTVVAATNRPDRIDKALLRPGRLDRIVYVPLPDEMTRRQLFDLQLKKMPTSKTLDINMLVARTQGYSGAEVLAVCHEAALKALEEDISAQIVDDRHFLKALDIVSPRTPPSLLKLYEDYLSR